MSGTARRGRSYRNIQAQYVAQSSGTAILPDSKSRTSYQAQFA